MACQAQQVCVNVNTRSQTEKLANEELKEKLLCEQGAASPDSVDIKQTEEEEKQCYSDDTEVVKDTSSDDLQEELIENESPDTKALTKNISEQGDTDEWPLPNLSDKGDKQKLVAQQQQDPSLHKIRKWAELGENQYNYNEGVLVHFQEGEVGHDFMQIVVPVDRRQQLFFLAHASPTAGHFSKRKTLGVLQHAFTWPGMAKDITKWCTECPEFQKGARVINNRVPLIPLPVISTPFTRMAFDLVGPLPRTKRGNKYILIMTCMCLGSKYPEAIPLKQVDVETVAEEMLEVFSRTGIPCEILTDQGSVFTGRLMKELCSVLGISHLKTSPYHPQTDGCLGRWHSSLKTMLKKKENRQEEWDRLLKYLLFAYRQAPHANTNYSPFELIYGRQLRGPLDMVKESWISGDVALHDVCQWVAELRTKLKLMQEIACKREVQAKTIMKRNYDTTSKPRELEIGSSALMRIPDLGGKLSNTWDGPYEVIRKVTPVTYELAVPNKRKKKSHSTYQQIKEVVHS